MLKVLSDSAIAKAKPDGRNHMLSDRQALGKGRGALVLRISPAGARTWYFRRTVSGRTFVYPMGSWAADDVAGLPLAAARTRARDLADLCDREGIDDLAAYFVAKEGAARAAEETQRAELAEEARRAEAARSRTVEVLLHHYLAHLRMRGKSSAADAERLFRVHVYPQPVSARPAAEVTPREVTAALRRIVEKGRGRTAAKVRSYMRAAWQLALGAEHDPAAPAALVDFEIANNPVASTASMAQFSRARKRPLSESELADLLSTLGKEEGAVAAVARLLLLLGGQRPVQLLRARVEDWNAAEGTLRLLDPKGRRTEARVHLVPVEGDAVALIAYLAKRSADAGCPWLFTTDFETPMRPETVNAQIVARCTDYLAKLRAEDPQRLLPTPYSARDIRSTVETALAARGVSRETRAQLQSHGLGGVQGRHYDAHDYQAEKRAAIRVLHAYFRELTEGERASGKVRRLPRKARAA